MPGALPPSLANALATLGRACQDLLFPPSCLGCRAALPSSREPLFCLRCREDLQWLNSPLCTCCGRPLASGAGGDHYCGNCLHKPPHFSRARAALLYQSPINTAIQSCKYHGDLAGLASFAALAQASQGLASLTTGPRVVQPRDGKSEAGNQSSPTNPGAEAVHRNGPNLSAGTPTAIPALAWDFILPVPLHLLRLRSRGFNQALLLARVIFPQARDKIRTDLLQRRRWTEPQTGMSGGQRRRNLRDAFSVARPPEIKNRRVLLVDDVFTTGSTVNECARVLKKSGAAEVEVFTLARVRE